MTNVEDALEELRLPGKIFLGIKADDTDKNFAVHDAFRRMADEEFPKCHDNYTRALEKLLNYYDNDSKTEMLWNEINALSLRISELEGQKRDVKEPVNVPF